MNVMARAATAVDISSEVGMAGVELQAEASRANTNETIRSADREESMGFPGAFYGCGVAAEDTMLGCKRD
jgi:hypothetical protein